MPVVRNTALLALGVSIGILRGKKRRAMLEKRKQIATNFAIGLKRNPLKVNTRFDIDNYRFFISQEIVLPDKREHFKVQVIDLTSLSNPLPDVVVLDYYPLTDRSEAMLSWPPHGGRKNVDWF